MTAPDVCFITTCRGRRVHLEQTLPRMVAQPGTSCVVVDYGCPDGTGDWVEATYPQVKAVRSGDTPRFELARARNLGAAATHATWLCFLDADTVLADNFMEVVQPLLGQRGSYFRPRPVERDKGGMCIFHNDDFKDIGGYDDVLQGWGMEDLDIYARADMGGLSAKTFPASLVTMIPHGGVHGGPSRTAHFEIQSTDLNCTANLVYCRAKWDLTRLSGRQIDATRRAELYRNITRGVLAAQERGDSVQVRVPVTSIQTLTRSPVDVSLVYDVGKPGTAVGMSPLLRPEDS